VLAACSALGLAAALLADGWADLLSWLLLGVPLVVIAWRLLLPSPPRS
jgi:hypothetical protein